jgi:hypothetical protein
LLQASFRFEELPISLFINNRKQRYIASEQPGAQTGHAVKFRFGFSVENAGSAQLIGYCHSMNLSNGTFQELSLYFTRVLDPVTARE